MTKSEMFQALLTNIAVDNAASISQRYGELTSALNKAFRDTDSKTANSLQVGSYGRWTAIKGISDLDMLYIMPKAKWDTYKDSKQLKLLQDAKAAIDLRYPGTKTKVDRNVVVVTFQNFEIEVVPVFQRVEGGFLFPDSYGDGSWPTTNPQAEISAVSTLDAEKNGNLRRLCKMARAWKNKHGVGMGGLLIDTLAYNFLNSTSNYDTKSYSSYDRLVRDFFEYLKDLPNQDYYKAPGSQQHVRVKKRFQRKAKKAFNLANKAIEAEGKDYAHDRWKKLFGRPFPARPQEVEEAALSKAADAWDNTEQFVEDRFGIDVRFNVEIDCEVSQNGFREFFLRDVTSRIIPLKAKKRLLFNITANDTPAPFDVYWKVLNRGGDTYKRNCVRGQIVRDEGHSKKKETTDFRGEHIVECYIVKNGVVVAKDRIDVPIG